MKDKDTRRYNLCFKNKYDDSHVSWYLTKYEPGKEEALKTMKHHCSGLIEAGAVRVDGESYSSLLQCICNRSHFCHGR